MTDAAFLLFLALDLAATLVFAATGALAARRKGFDVVLRVASLKLGWRTAPLDEEPRDGE